MLLSRLFYKIIKKIYYIKWKIKKKELKNIKVILVIKYDKIILVFFKKKIN